MKDKYKIIIAGGRDIDNYEVVRDALEESLIHKDVSMSDIEIVQGGATGVDRSAKYISSVANASMKEFKADWNTHGRAAGPIRNKQMAEYADALILIWDGKSRGSASMLKEAEKQGLDIKQVLMRKKWTDCEYRRIER